MANDSYLVFIPETGSPWTGEGHGTHLVDPFEKSLSDNAFFPIESWSVDVEQTLNIGSQSSGAGAGKIAFNPFTVTRHVDKVSPQLFMSAAAGSAFKFVDLIERRSAGHGHSGQVYLAWRFGLVAVKTVAWSSDEPTPKETVSFEYGSLTIDYFPQNPDGSLSGGIQAGWDRVRNVRV